MNVFEALGISVTAGILVLLLLGASRILWRYALENIYLQVTCRHITDISGKWNVEYTDIHGHSCYDETKLVQHGYKIKGYTNYRIAYNDDRPEKHKTFKLHGLLRNDIFTAYYWNTDRRKKGSGTFSLVVSEEGNIMRGKYAWFDVESDTIDTGDHEWHRVEE